MHSTTSKCLFAFLEIIISLILTLQIKHYQENPSDKCYAAEIPG